jgi:hypothetical protein
VRYFQKLIEGVNVMPIAHSLMRQPGLWNEDRVRTSFENSPHVQVDDIILRFGKPDGEDLLVSDRPAMAKLHPAKKVALDLMGLVGGSQLGRMVITRLEPGKKILPHKDVNGAYANYYSRYHVVLQGLPGSLFMCGDETVNMLTGEVWCFDASAEHMVANNSKDDRIHMLVDIRIDA